ncbi:MAG TPA: sodium/proline symporter [Phycisphaerales bacterium]|nr:sodium/proline symporter [Phycisphaerales bacterium]
MSSLVVTGSFIFFLILFTAIGILSAKEKKSTSEDYLVASRSVNPWLTALSAVSTNNSGYMFIGLIGFAWRQGFEAIWITFGWIVGDFLTWLWVHRRVRAQSEEVNASSVPALLARDRDGNNSRAISLAAGILTFFFLGGYAAAQLKAGSTTLNALFGWPLWAGSVIGILVVVIYCFSGGIRASIWTDSAQSIVMLVSMTVLMGACWLQVGGLAELRQSLAAIDPQLVEIMPRGLAFGLGLYVLGFIFGGIGTIGQPHILIRFMAIDEVDSIKTARTIYFLWYTYFSAAALLVGLYSRVLLPDLTEGLKPAAAVAATEGALPTLAVEMLPSLLIGLMLAGIFSATMSTADSQILSCSAAVTQDIFPRWSKSYSASKMATLSVALVALAIALTASSGVFALVLVAWSALSATIGPILLIRLANLPLPSWLGVTMMVTGLSTVVLWGYSGFAGSVFKALPGMLIPLILYGFYYGISTAKGEFR